MKLLPLILLLLISCGKKETATDNTTPANMETISPAEEKELSEDNALNLRGDYDGDSSRPYRGEDYRDSHELNRARNYGLRENSRYDYWHFNNYYYVRPYGKRHCFKFRDRQRMHWFMWRMKGYWRYR